MSVLRSLSAGEVVLHSDLTRPPPWPLFDDECTAAGYRSVCAIPMRLKSHNLGCLNLFMSEPGGLTDADATLTRP